MGYLDLSVDPDVVCSLAAAPAEGRVKYRRPAEDVGVNPCNADAERAARQAEAIEFFQEVFRAQCAAPALGAPEETDPARDHGDRQFLVG
jgi:hypothetical protein